MPGKFSLQWVNTPDYKRPMCTARFTLRDALSSSGEGGLTAQALHLDQVHIHFRPSTDIATSEFVLGDNADLEWVNETLQLYVRVSPGVRYTLYTSAGAPYTDASDGETSVHPQRSLTYSVALSPAYATSGDGDDTFCKTYRPIRDIPVLEDAANVSEFQLDLLWPLLQGDDRAVSWTVPGYRIRRVVAEFSYRL